MYVTFLRFSLFLVEIGEMGNQVVVRVQCIAVEALTGKILDVVATNSSFVKEKMVKSIFISCQLYIVEMGGMCQSRWACTITGFKWVPELI